MIKKKKPQITQTPRRGVPISNKNYKQLRHVICRLFFFSCVSWLVLNAAHNDSARANTLKRIKTDTNELAQHIGSPCHGVQHIGPPCHGVQHIGPPCHGVRVRILEKYHPAAVIISDSENRDEGALIDRRSNFPVEFPFSQQYVITIPGKAFQRGYKGRLILEWDKNELLIVNEVPLEDYVASVVLSEMGWTETEAMRAQAVLARTWAVVHRRGNCFYDFDDLAYHQVYKGLFPQSELTLQRLSETDGQVLTFQGKPVEVFYHAQCADRVFSAYEIWGKRDIPYLKKVELPPVLKQVRGDNTWEQVLSKQAVDAVFSGETGAASFLRYRKAVKNGQLGVYVNDCWIGIDNFRLRINRVLGWNRVKSNDFSIRVIGDKIVFRGRGFGHLVGLGQRDAVFLAQKRYDYIQILKLFYPGCTTRRGPHGMGDLDAAQFVWVGFPSVSG